MFTPLSSSLGSVMSTENSRSGFFDGVVSTNRNLYFPGREPVFKITTAWHDTIVGGICEGLAGSAERTTTRSRRPTIVTRPLLRLVCVVEYNKRQPKLI